MVESPIMANLALQIHRHTESLDGLQAEVDSLYEAEGEEKARYPQGLRG